MITTKNPRTLTLVYALPFVLIVTILFVLLQIWEQRNMDNEETAELKDTAMALVQQILLTRTWNDEHGGVYAEISERTRPNQYLDDPQRDITSLTGRHYTKINHSYMTRQIAELALERHQYHQHLTSLRPLNPANTPDPWEEQALQSFELGATQQMTVVQEKDERLFRLMVPLVSEKSCLECHAKQHDRLGDVRGGLSVAIPMAEADRIHAAQARAFLLAGLGLWASIMVFIVLVSYTLSRQVLRDMKRELELSSLKAVVELAGSAAHEIRQPLTVLVTDLAILRRRHSADDGLLKKLEAMNEQCRRIDATIAKMQNITNYKTKAYVGSSRIVDLDDASHKGDG